MNRKKKILFLGIAAAVFYYLIDSLLGILFFHDNTFLESLISDVPVYELSNRLRDGCDPDTDFPC